MIDPPFKCVSPIYSGISYEVKMIFHYSFIATREVPNNIYQLTTVGVSRVG